jgi:hypothetical protein
MDDTKQVYLLFRGIGVSIMSDTYQAECNHSSRLRTFRVFPRRTNATPNDENVRIGYPEMWDKPDKVHISVSFTWDIPKAESMYKTWSQIAPTEMGGPALGDRGDEFEPGMYLKKGYTITSRGCPNHCWFCDVWKREGKIRELQIKEGNNILDSNLLACSQKHQENVFKMLLTQKNVRFTGGLEAKRFTKWHVFWLKIIKPKAVFFAYDTIDDYLPLLEAVELLKQEGIKLNHNYRCYVLIGYGSDTIEKARDRLQRVINLGLMPQAMLFNRYPNQVWRRFQREWANPTILGSKMRGNNLG